MVKEPVVQKMKVLDVRPYHYGVYCCIEEGKPFVNEIVGKDWSEDGEKVIFMLETHNFLFHSPWDEMDVVAMDRKDGLTPKEDGDFMSKRPSPVKKCEACHGTGKIELSREAK